MRAAGDCKKVAETGIAPQIEPASPRIMSNDNGPYSQTARHSGPCAP